MLWSLFKRVMGNCLLDFGELVELAMKVAFAIVLLPLVLAWPGILIFRTLSWLQTSEWLSVPAGSTFLGKPPETLWLGADSIIAWFWDVDLATWSFVAFLFAALGLVLDYLAIRYQIQDVRKRGLALTEVWREHQQGQ